MKKVKMLIETTGSKGRIKKGEILEVSDTEAKVLVSAGKAEYVKASKRRR